MRAGGWLLAAALALAATAATAQQTTLSVLSYNTHGLAGWIAGDAPEARFPQIARRAARYELVLLQEDFAHHALLREHAVHPRIVRGSTAYRAGLGFLCTFCSGSGLTLLTRLPEEALTRVASHAFARCHGWVGAGNDCLASKGFEHLRLRLAPGLELDVVNTHLDAGDAEGDRAARASQLDELAAYLESVAAGRALLIAGDLNLAADRPEDMALLARLNERLGLRDSGSAPCGDWRQVDWMLVRDGREAGLEVLAASEDTAFVAEGEPLSDHPALALELRVRRLD